MRLCDRIPLPNSCSGSYVQSTAWCVDSIIWWSRWLMYHRHFESMASDPNFWRQCNRVVRAVQAINQKRKLVVLTVFTFVLQLYHVQNNTRQQYWSRTHRSRATHTATQLPCTSFRYTDFGPWDSNQYNAGTYTRNQNTHISYKWLIHM